MPTDLSRLISSLNNSKIRSGGQDRQDPALYQVIFTLIKELQANKAIQGEAAPTAHATTHYAPGTDPVDILQLSGYTGTTTDFLRADGTWQLNSGSGITQLTGDVAAGPGTGSVVSTIANNAITTVKVADGQISYAKIQDVSAASRILGRGDSGAGDVQELVLGTNLSITGTTINATSTTSTVQLSGDVVAGPGSGLLVSTIQNNVVTFAKFQTIAESRLVGRGQGSGAGNVQEIVLGTNLTMTGTTISASGGGGSLSFSTALATSSTVGTASTLVDINGCSMSLTPGTWMIWGRANLVVVVTTYLLLALTDSSNNIVIMAQGSQFTGGDSTTLDVFSTIVVASTTSYKLRFESGRNDTFARQVDTVYGSIVTNMMGLKIA